VNYSIFSDQYFTVKYLSNIFITVGKNHDLKKVKNQIFLFKSDFFYFLNSYFRAKFLPNFETGLSAQSHK